MPKEHEGFDERFTAERHLNLKGVRGYTRVDHRDDTTTFGVSDEEVVAASGDGLMQAEDYLQGKGLATLGLFDKPNGLEQTRRGIRFKSRGGQVADDLEGALQRANLSRD